MQASEEPVAEQQDADSTQDLGVRLRAAREAQELSLEDLSAELRIASHHLAALEQCRYEALGAPVFAKGYLKQYAGRLGLDVGAVAAEYDRTAGRPGIDIAPSKTIRLRDERQITVWIVAGLALALVAVFLLLWWLRQNDEPAASAVVPATADAPAPISEPIAAAVTEPIAGPAAEPDAAPIVPSAQTSAAGEPPDLPAVTGSLADSVAAPEAAGAVAPNAAPNAAPARAGSPAAAAPAVEPITGPVLEIAFVEDSWAEVTAPDGERLFYDLGRAGTSVRLPADPAMNLFFGNAAGVELRLDGNLLAIPAWARRRANLAQFDLSALLD